MLVFEGNLFPCITLPPLPGCFWDFSVFCFYQIYYTVLIFFVFIMPWVYRASWICGWGLLLVLENSQAYAIFFFALLPFPVQYFDYIYFRSYNLCNTMSFMFFLVFNFPSFCHSVLNRGVFSDLSSNSLFLCVCVYSAVKSSLNLVIAAFFCYLLGYCSFQFSVKILQIIIYFSCFKICFWSLFYLGLLWVFFFCQFPHLGFWSFIVPLTAYFSLSATN